MASSPVHDRRCRPLPYDSASAWGTAFFLPAVLWFVGVFAGQAQTLPDLFTFDFAVVQKKTLPGASASPGNPCNGTIGAADRIENLAVAAVFYQNACYTDGRYNHNDYPVEFGTVSAAGGGPSFAAYRIHEPLKKATQFLASQHAIYYRFPTIENYTVYSFAGGSLSKVVDVPAAAIVNTNSFIPVSAAAPLTVSETEGSVTYVFAPSAVRVSSYTPLGPGVEGARVASTPFGDVLKYRYTVAGTPFDTALDFSAGPESHANIYSDRRRFFLVRHGDAGAGVVWQNQADASVKLTWFGANRRSPVTAPLANPQAQGLVGATGDDAGHVYYLTVQTGSGKPNTPRGATLTKAGPTGVTLASTALDTSVAGLNMVEFFNVASLQHLNGKLALMLGRTMHQSGDGLNHQGGIAVVFNAATLAVEQNWGQTSGHSFENVLTTNARGEFVGLDLGDNYPRGVHLHKFTDTTLHSRVISSFKTLHGTTARSPAGATYPAYEEISGGATTYYRWSNDNRTYTELGGVVPTPLGYAVSFVGERSPAGRLLDNGRTGATLNDPRNIGLVTVIEEFQNATGSGAEVSDDLVVTNGLVEAGGFYSFGGGWTPQRNAGVVWLSNYTDPAHHASRLKMSPRADGSLLLLWELWSPTSYLGTRGMSVSATGTVIQAETDLGSHLRLGRRDDPMRLDNAILLVSANKADSALELTVIESATPSAPPRVELTVTRAGSNIVIDWPTTVNGVLQQSESLTPTSWINAPNGAIRPVTLPATTAKMFYRLVHTP